MSIKQKISLTIILVLLAGIGIGYSVSYFTQKKDDKKTDTTSSATSTSTNNAPQNSSNTNNTADLKTTPTTTLKTYSNTLLPGFSLKYDDTKWKLSDGITENLGQGQPQFPDLKITKGNSVVEIPFSGGEGYGGAGTTCVTTANFVKLNDTWGRIYDTQNKIYNYAKIKGSNIALPSDSNFDSVYNDYANWLKLDVSYGTIIPKANVGACFGADEDLNFTKTTIKQTVSSQLNTDRSGFRISTNTTNTDDLDQIDKIVVSIISNDPLANASNN